VQTLAWWVWWGKRIPETSGDRRAEDHGR
jgi:hypothetical protein